MKIFDKVQIEVKTTFGTVNVEFTIICEINKNNCVYGLIAQNRVVVGQYMVDNTWRLSDSIDLMNVPILNTFHQDVTGEQELNSLESQSYEG